MDVSAQELLGPDGQGLSVLGVGANPAQHLVEPGALAFHEVRPGDEAGLAVFGMQIAASGSVVGHLQRETEGLAAGMV